MYIKGISTRDVGDVLKEMEIEGMSVTQVSSATKEARRGTGDVVPSRVQCRQCHLQRKAFNRTPPARIRKRIGAELWEMWNAQGGE